MMDDTAGSGGAGRGFPNDQAERLFQGCGLDKDHAGRRAEVVGNAGGRRHELHSGRRGERDLFEAPARTLSDRIEDADVLDLIAEEIKAAWLARGDWIDVDDSTAHGVLPGRFADGLRVVIKLAQLGDQTLK